MSEVQPDEKQLQAHPVIRGAQRFVNYYVAGCHRFRLLSPCPIPPDGPAILVCNHISGLDPVLLQSVTPRPIVWLMAREYYDQPWVRWFLRLIQAIPVERTGHDMAATRSALRALARGRLLGIFPEGRLGSAGRLLPFQTGSAVLALRGGADVYPAAITGSLYGTEMLEAYFYSHEVRLSFGGPVKLDRASASPQAIEDSALKMRSAVADLLRQYHRIDVDRLSET